MSEQSFLSSQLVSILWNKIKSKVAQSSLPVGTVVLWCGSEDEIPNGYAICDGQNGTPDLRGKIVVGDGLTTLMSGYPVFESTGTSPYVQLYYIKKIS